MCIYDVYGPCSCPHGRCFTILAQCFIISSWVSSLMAITTCFYMYVRPIPEEGQPELPREGFGYISRQAGVLEPPNYRQCVFYDREEKQEYFDSMWRAGKAMSLMACGIGGIVMCIVMCTCCVAFQLPTFEGLFWTCMFCFVAQALTFLSWGSDMCDTYECTWSSGTGMNITAAMLWVWAANMIKSFPEALPPRGRRKKPLYEDDPDDGYADRGFDDEYDDEYGEEDEFDNDGQYYDDDYDNSYYDDPDQQYYDDDNDNSEYPTEYVESSPDKKSRDVSTDDDEEEFQPDGYLGAHDPYETDYQEPDPVDQPKYKQGRDDDFEPDPQLEPGEDASQFTSEDDSNAFRNSGDDTYDDSQDLSEVKFLGDGDNRQNKNDASQGSFSNID